MREIHNKLENINKQLEKIEDEKYKSIFSCFYEMIEDLSQKVEDISLKQEYLEENVQYIGDDLTDIQEELFEELSFDDLEQIEDEYVEIKCLECEKPLFVEKQALDDNTTIPCPFCNGKAK